jgi:arylsulfatase A-like enzyme
VQYLDHNQDMITTWYTERAVDFINRNAHHPFFLYVPHSMVHVPLFVSDKFRDTTERGLFGDVMQEVDWSVGQILDALHTNGIDENTLIFFSSDNGPWLVYGEHCGSAGPFREGKGTSWEGGVREPTIMRWPGQIPAGTVCEELASTMDMLPTVTRLAGGTLPSHTIDGHDIRSLMFGEPGAQSPWDAFYIYYQGGQLQAVRSGEWKLILPHKYRSLNGRPGGIGGVPTKYESLEAGLALYNVKNDLGETTNVIDQYPDVVARLQALAEKGREELGDTLTGRKGKGVRPVGEA